MTMLSIGLPLVGDAGDSMSNVSTICETSFGCFWNNTHAVGTECVRSLALAHNDTACAQGQPVVLVMTSFFTSGGIIMLAIMGVILLAIVSYVGIKKGKR